MCLLAHSRCGLIKYPIASNLKIMLFSKKIVMLTCISVAAIVILLQGLNSVSSGNYSSNTFCLFLPYQDEGSTLLRTASILD